jgi:hypothetical protein
MPPLSHYPLSLPYHLNTSLSHYLTALTALLSTVSLTNCLVPHCFLAPMSFWPLFHCPTVKVRRCHTDPLSHFHCLRNLLPTVLLLIPTVLLLISTVTLPSCPPVTMPQHRTAFCFAAILISQPPYPHCLTALLSIGLLTIYLIAPLSSCSVSFCPQFHCLTASVPLSH